MKRRRSEIQRKFLHERAVGLLGLGLQHGPRSLHGAGSRSQVDGSAIVDLEVERESPGERDLAAELIFPAASQKVTRSAFPSGLEADVFQRVVLV